MADISKITIETNTYNIKDEVARQKISFAPIVYNNASIMTSTSSLVQNAIVKTLGFYEINDGGGAYYKIVRDNSLVADGSFIINLKNSLKAVLIYNDIVNIKQLGARPQDSDNNKYDIAPFIQAYLNQLKINNNLFTLFIPAGVWYSSPVLFDNEYGFSIEGQEFWQNYACQSTTICSLNLNQQYIWKIGDGLKYINGFTLKNITFSSGDYLYYSDNNNFRVPDANVKTIQTALALHYAAFGILDNIYFEHIIGECLSIQSCWELRFSKLNITHASNFGGGLLVFKTLDTTLTQNVNVSNIEIEQLNAEIVNGDIIKCEYNCGLIDSVIQNYHFEPSSCSLQNATSHELTDGSFNLNNARKLALINVAGTCNLIINNILLNNIAYRYILQNNIQYFYNTILNITMTSKEDIAVTINNVMIQGMNNHLNIALQETSQFNVSNLSKITLNNIENHSSYDCRFRVNYFPTIVNYAILRNTKNQPRSFLNNQLSPFYKYTRNADNDLRRFLSYDNQVLNDDMIAVQPITNSQTIFCNTALTGDTLFIRAKIPTGKTYKLVVSNPTYSSLKAFNLVGNDNFQTYECDVSDIAPNFKNNPTCIMYSHTDNTQDYNVSLDYFFFK